jgi:hypothetical protein
MLWSLLKGPLMISRKTRPEKSDLVDAVKELRDEVSVLRNVLDELVTAVQWQNNNAADYPFLVSDYAGRWAPADLKLPSVAQTRCNSEAESVVKPHPSNSEPAQIPDEQTQRTLAFELDSSSSGNVGTTRLTRRKRT